MVAMQFVIVFLASSFKLILCSRVLIECGLQTMTSSGTEYSASRKGSACSSNSTGSSLVVSEFRELHHETLSASTLSLPTTYSADAIVDRRPRRLLNLNTSVVCNSEPVSPRESRRTSVPAIFFRPSTDGSLFKKLLIPRYLARVVEMEWAVRSIFSCAGPKPIN